MVEILCAYLLDLCFGDPLKLPHPIRWIGRLIETLERVYRKTFHFPKTGGLALTLSVVLITYATTSTLLFLASLIHPLASALLGTVILFYCFSVKSLTEASTAVLQRLEAADLPGARKALSMIVGRDTAELGEKEIVRASVETVSENSVDGFISPLFYAILGGPALAMTYKAINTLDSMVGYKNEKYIDFGLASARLDDVANYLPARISVFLIAIGAFIGGDNARNAFHVGFRDGRNHTSPNSGFSEAAFAGALGVQLGGASSYGGKVLEKPTIGDTVEELEGKHIKQANALLFRTASVTIILALLIIFIL